MVSKKQFGKLYEQALAYLVCHKMKLAGLGKNALGDIDPISAGLSVSSVSEGGRGVPAARVTPKWRYAVK